jgi:hypothetical protein
MTYELKYNDLINLMSENSSPGCIYWLRLLCEDTCVVAIVTEVPLNPGLPMYHNTDDISRHIEHILSIDTQDLTFYRVVPRGYPIPEAPAVFTEDKRSMSLDVLEGSLGLKLPRLPENLELRRSVMELGGAEAKYERREFFEAVPVTDLPPPHNPYRCAHSGRFNAMATEPGWMGLPEVGQRFLDSLTSDDIAACWWHQAADWAAIANESVRVVETVGSLKPKSYYLEEARRSDLPGEDPRWLKSLFEDPIIIAGGGYTEGQHRACALRFSSGSRSVAAVTGYERVATRMNDWQYEGDG